MVVYTTSRRRVAPLFRQEASPPPLSHQDAASWDQLRPLMLTGPETPVRVRGTIVSTADDDSPLETRVWLDGGRVRLERPDGSPVLVLGDSLTWRFGDATGEQRPLVSPRRELDSWYEARVAFRRSQTEADLFGFSEPVGPFAQVGHLGRPAWSFAFWPPRSKPSPMHVVVDATTGLTLHVHLADPGRHVEWTTFDEVDTLPAELFAWHGPVQTEDELRAEQDAEHEQDMAERGRWFRDHVTTVPLSVRAPLDVLVNQHSADGRFYATLTGPFDGGLTRRPRASTRWRTGMSKVDHGWSDERWDWAVSVWDDELTPDEVATLQRQLGSRPTT